MPSITRWWFQICFIFIPTWGDDPSWLIFFRWVETTNQIKYLSIESIYYSNLSFNSWVEKGHQLYPVCWKTRTFLHIFLQKKRCLTYICHLKKELLTTWLAWFLYEASGFHFKGSKTARPHRLGAASFRKVVGRHGGFDMLPVTLPIYGSMEKWYIYLHSGKLT